MNDIATDIEAQLADPLSRRLLEVFQLPTGTSSSGYPFLARRAWHLYRDSVPHVLGMGLQTYRATQAIRELAEEAQGEATQSEEANNIVRACRVSRQIVFTAAITAPTDLWLTRHLLGTFGELGLSDRLLAGEAITPEWCTVGGIALDARELETDLHFLLSRGFVEAYDDAFRIAGHHRARTAFERFGPVAQAGGIARVWAKLFGGEELDAAEQESLQTLSQEVPRRDELDQNHWIPTHEEIELGYRLVPVVLGLRARDLTSGLDAGTDFADLAELGDSGAEGLDLAAPILEAAGWLEDGIVTAIGDRGFARAPGPFGIIETYHPYLTHGASILKGERDQVWVKRGDNVGASQDANAGTFRRANDALDTFCEDYDHRLEVFIEHAIGRGEATRQRFDRSGDDTIQYFGADLEDAAIDAAVAEQKAGRLPQRMEFVRHADIGEPARLIDAIRASGADPRGAVMLVGNGFHEVREQTDEKMIEVFEGYREAGIILLFTEENALAIDDLRATAFNTYHAGFKYVHEKSGQGLRPAEHRPRPRLGQRLRASWEQCATRAGYVKLDAYSSRTRTIYPYTRPGLTNPSISVNLFFVPADLLDELSA